MYIFLKTALAVKVMWHTNQLQDQTHTEQIHLRPLNQNKIYEEDHSIFRAELIPLVSISNPRELQKLSLIFSCTYEVWEEFMQLCTKQMHGLTKSEPKWHEIIIMGYIAWVLYYKKKMEATFIIGELRKVLVIYRLQHLL